MSELDEDQLFADLEANREIQCDTKDCEAEAQYMIRVHPGGPTCGCSLRCKDCLESVHRQNFLILRQYGAIRCRGCDRHFGDLRSWMEIGALDGN